MAEGGLDGRGRRCGRWQAGGRSAEEVPIASARGSGCSQAAARRAEGDKQKVCCCRCSYSCCSIIVRSSRPCYCCCYIASPVLLLLPQISTPLCFLAKNLSLLPPPSPSPSRQLCVFSAAALPAGTHRAIYRYIDTPNPDLLHLRCYVFI